MKILTEQEQKQNKMTELARLRQDVLFEIEKLRAAAVNESSKERSYFLKVDYRLIDKLHKRMDSMYKVAEAIMDYRDMIQDSIQD